MTYNETFTAKPSVLAVDLDGTLLRSDMLYESFWGAFSKNLLTPLIALRALTQGRAFLKHRLGAMVTLDAALLPYNQDVIDYVRRWREQGGRALLVTACNQTLADRIGEHLGIFDEVRGSDQVTNLKGTGKADWLEERFGRGGFVYIGNDSSDLLVWERGGGIVAVDPNPRLKRRITALDGKAEIISGQGSLFGAHLKALRPHQWLKNALVFLPMFAAHRWDAATLLYSVLAFIAFSLTASSVYVLNDLLDLSADRAHPRKRKRPFASGSVPIAHGTWMALGLWAAGFGVALVVGPLFTLGLLGYFGLTTAYSLDLKRRLIIDICTLTALYTIRIVCGGIATGIPLSVWLLAFSLFFFLSLAAVKRQAELVFAAKSGTLKAYGRGYHTEDLMIVSQMAIASGYVSILILALYLNSPTVAELYPNPHALWGICVVLLYWISRVAMLTHRGHMADDPVVFAVKDRKSQVCGLLVAGFIILGALL